MKNTYWIIVILLIASYSCSNPMNKKTPTYTEGLRTYVERVLNDPATLPQERTEKLDQLAAYLVQKKEANELPKLVFICTHNSRRSHMSQLWAAVAAHHADVEVQVYSGGTESTAFHPNAIAALKRAGFEINAENNAENTKYKVDYLKDGESIVSFSKRYDEKPNPSNGFAAVMTCSEADKGCPMVAGADFRIPISYLDPKIADGLPEQDSTYDARCYQIAREQFYLFGKVKQLLKS